MSAMIDKIKEMNEAEWNAFRQLKWDEKNKKIPTSSTEMPANHMPDKEKYANWVEQNKSRFPKMKVDPEEVRKMSSEEWEKFRIDRWEKKIQFNQKQKSQKEVPDWFMKTKDGYIEYLANNKSKKS